MRAETRPRRTGIWPGRCSAMAKRYSMRDGPLAQLFKATEAAAPEPPAAPEESPAPAREQPQRPRRTQRPTLVDVPDAGGYAETRLPKAEASAYLAVIRVVGVGGGGCNAIDRMIESGIQQVEFIAVNTDMQQLQGSNAPIKIHIGRESTRGLGSGADPEVGRTAAEGAYDRLKTALRGSDMGFVTAGGGGGTGSGAAPALARIA